jgi:hypothetical protein
VRAAARKAAEVTEQRLTAFRFLFSFFRFFRSFVRSPDGTNGSGPKWPAR